MGQVQFLDDAVLFVEDQVAMDPACCCETVCTCARCIEGVTPCELLLTPYGYVSDASWMNDSFVVHQMHPHPTICTYIYLLETPVDYTECVKDSELCPGNFRGRVFGVYLHFFSTHPSYSQAVYGWLVSAIGGGAWTDYFAHAKLTYWGHGQEGLFDCANLDLDLSACVGFYGCDCAWQGPFGAGVSNV